MKVKTPQPKAVEEDPAVKAQRLAAEKAATDQNNQAVGDILERKTRLKARVFGVASGSAGGGAAGGASGGGAFVGSASTGPSYSVPTGFSVGNIWKGGMF